MTAAGALTGRLRDFAELVKFSHTLFLFPFALSALVLAAQQRPVTFGLVFWVVVALVAARSAAMIMNRIADRRWDALNPRTATRPLVTGKVSIALAWGWLALASGLLVLAAYMLNPLCFKLSPVALAWVLGYSFTKRFTWLCHLWLGAATALAPLGTWIAVTGAWDWRAVVLAVAVTLWVAGFDVIYACQDIAFDQEHALKSLPARLGLENALWVSRGMHLLAGMGFLLLWPLFGLGSWYLAGALVVCLALVVEQILVAIKQANIPMAFFTVNGFISIVYFLFLAVDRLSAS
ncbi:MAG: putative 4-hydroxybenzoate polyprenyltransferase [Desulfarculaceae bacterium]|nr:putative 4-hydroxybenzoate polyprenyltransferase [Desulfarculaceae bacterium]MCF8072010.1 putative 4-hydroxybenzoate polyprenyltransferase [Desulfarculaceae bacterium]MCF8101527.1 putative 4-hydroxybenzoate polyprenyltransferase [Desulfarculaceae bacterium]MCF8115077.1 putative 4-hydroxybenzoate polyprenyltransferase [Desulfarculaceae bacterium]